MYLLPKSKELGGKTKLRNKAKRTKDFSEMSNLAITPVPKQGHALVLARCFCVRPGFVCLMFLGTNVLFPLALGHVLHLYRL